MINKIKKILTPKEKASALDTLLSNVFVEQRRARRWGIFFKLLTFAYILLFFAIFSYAPSSDSNATSKEFTALIKLHGVIAPEAEVNAKDFRISLKKAYENKGTKAILLSINSPGGSPVQSGIINDEIKRMKAIHPEIPIKVVVEDICASGGYYIAVAADEIYANKASIVGSIGVLINGFGFTEALKKIGVERRLMTAGENKGILDPFSPVNLKQEKHVKNLLAEVHQQFIDVVKEGRGSKLSQNSEIFSGLFWNGESALQLGLIDGFGDVYSVARDNLGYEEVVDFTTYETFADRFAKKIGAGISSSFDYNFLLNKFNIN
jgi:protease-4